LHLKFSFSGSTASEDEVAAALKKKGSSLFGNLASKVGLGPSADKEELKAKALAAHQREAAEAGTRSGVLYLCVVEARELMAKDDGGVSDP
jgi:hypothetical protein